MAFGMVSLEKRLSNNIKNYSLDQLFQINELSDYMEAAAHVSGQGEHGIWTGFT